MNYVWATVTAVSPLAIRIDTEDAPLIIPPETLVGGLQIGDRVWVQLYGRQAIIVGRSGGLPNTGYVTSGIGTAASGWTLDTQRGIIRSGIAFVYLLFTRTGGTITVPATGDITNTAVFQLDAAWFPPSSPAALLPGLTSSSAARVAAGTVNGTGMIQLVAVAPGANIDDGNTFSLYGSWPVA